MSDELDKLIAKAKARGPMGPEELQEQRISFAYGCLPANSTVTREDIARRDYERHGNLRALRERAELAEAEVARLREALEFISDDLEASGETRILKARAALEAKS